MARSVNNTGIGALYASFTIHETTGTADLTLDDRGAAVALSDDNEISHGSDGDRLLGRLENVNGSVATVQIGGVARLTLNGSNDPSVGDAVVVDGAGKIKQAPALTGDDPAGGNVARGICLAVDTTNDWADVLL